MVGALGDGLLVGIGLREVPAVEGAVVTSFALLARPLTLAVLRIVVAEAFEALADLSNEGNPLIRGESEVFFARDEAEVLLAPAALAGVWARFLV